MLGPAYLWALLVAIVLAACVLLASWSEPARAAFPGENGRLVLASPATSGPGVNNPTGDSEIFTMRPDGTGLIQLTHNTSTDTSPAWSPNGNKIAYDHEGADHGFEIYVMRADGTQKTQITDTPAPGSFSPTWSPNGRRIAFDSTRDDPNFDIYSVRTDGTCERRLTKNTGFDGSPEWSPDGTKIAFTTGRYSSTTGIDRSVAVMNADGSSPRRLTSNPPGYDTGSEWSPNGAWIAFQNRSVYYNIYKIRADGTGLKNLTKTESEHRRTSNPAWSPDGTKIAFSGVGSFGSDVGTGIVLMNPDGSGARLIPNTERFGAFSDLDWQRLPAR